MNCLAFASHLDSRMRSGVARRFYSSGKQIIQVLGGFVFLLAFLALGGKLEAQTFYGSISGVVKDPSGAVVPGVAVTVHENGTTTEYKTVSNKSGTYRISFLKPGGYTVRFEKNGFAQYVTDELNIVLNQERVVDGSLKLGATSEIVTVSGVASSLNTNNPQVGGELSTQELIDLPESTGTKGANEFLITKTFAGASSSSQDYSNVNNLSLGGGRAGTNPIIIDGLPSNMGIDGTYGLIPTPDSTEELQVLTAPFSAQYGQSGGGAILTTTKSGTEKFHGTAFESYSSQSLNALGYFTKPGTIIQPSYFHYFGGSIGGPVILPKLLDGRKHRLYFFTDWEYTLNHANAPFTTTVPTAAELTGDFSGLSPVGTPTVPIYDPLTTMTAGKVTSRTQFPGNIIPKSRIDQVGQNIAAFFPAANCTPTPTSPFNYCSNPISATSYLYNADRVDYNASDYDHLWAKFARDGPRNQPTIDIPNVANTSTYNGWTDDHDEISWSHIFSPRLSNEARVGYVSEVNFASPLPANASSIGLNGVPLTQFPSIKTNQYASFGAGGYSRTRDGHYILNDAMVMQIGRHTLSIGGEYMRYAYSSYKPGVLSGSYTFSGGFTAVPGQSGYGFADLLLGLPATTTISTTNTVFHYNLNYFAGYLQDDYRISSRLTINLGLRYEFDGPAAEKNNNYYSFNPNLMDATTGKPGGIEFAGFNGAPHSLSPNVYTGILPRVGFNYHLFRNTVVRGGYGIYQLPSIGFNALSNTSASTVSATFQTPTGSFTPAYQLSQGVPAYSPNVAPNGQPLIPSSLTNPTSSPVQLQLTAVLPYLQEWQVGVQQDLGHNWIAELDYMGDHGVHLPVVLPANQIAPSSTCCFNIKTAQSLRPYPQFLTVSNVTNGGAQSYAALFATLSHRWSNGISTRAAYTWARTQDDVDGGTLTPLLQNYYNLHAQWGTAKLSIPQRFSLSAVYALPVGSGGRFLSHSPIVSQAIGHWKVSTVAQFQVGLPYNVSQADQLQIGSGGQFVTETGNPNIARGSRSVAKWFNTSAFTITPPDTLGTGPRASFYGPGQNVWDISLMRDIPFREHAAFTLRVDAHNAFNHPQFSGLNTSLSATNTAFGTVTGAQDPRSLLLVGRLRF
ncbi:TonB-dependent receptor [Granulicella sp. dw_53]|uniref:TonB-dependent receptor n=1 Tax=Granulicella sp. dw_53 TaxID=2719792 RepID=UPI0021031385|nr:TonB-dependent receptor [Granulicella sp. dw_53]